MPANLTPQYKEAEQRFRDARSLEEKLTALREMLAILPKHKGTEKIHADIRRRIAKLEEEGDRAARAGGHRFDPGHVRREGAGQWVLLGPPNAGKSALLRALTRAHPEVAPYPFTTRTPAPGMMPFEDLLVQIVDTPAVTAEHCEPYMVNLVHNADGVIAVLDPTADDLEPSWRAIQALLARARVRPAGTPASADAHPFEVERPVMVALNKSDLDPDGTLRALARDGLGGGPAVYEVSAEHGEGLEAMRAPLFAALGRIRIYAKEPGKKADLERPFVLPRGATVHDLAVLVHKDLAQRLKFARIWGHAHFDGQQVDRHHALADRDVVELHG
ncbi:MAG: GTPase [Candidatus Eiseniibacteriota bacterium]